MGVGVPSEPPACPRASPSTQGPRAARRRPRGASLSVVRVPSGVAGDPACSGRLGVQHGSALIEPLALPPSALGPVTRRGFEREAVAQPEPAGASGVLGTLRPVLLIKARGAARQARCGPTWLSLGGRPAQRGCSGSQAPRQPARAALPPHLAAGHSGSGAPGPAHAPRGPGCLSGTACTAGSLLRAPARAALPQGEPSASPAGFPLWSLGSRARSPPAEAGLCCEARTAVCPCALLAARGRCAQHRLLSSMLSPPVRPLVGSGPRLGDQLLYLRLAEHRLPSRPSHVVQTSLSHPPAGTGAVHPVTTNTASSHSPAGPSAPGQGPTPGGEFMRPVMCCPCGRSSARRWCSPRQGIPMSPTG